MQNEYVQNYYQSPMPQVDLHSNLAVPSVPQCSYGQNIVYPNYIPIQNHILDFVENQIQSTQDENLKKELLSVYRDISLAIINKNMQA